MAAKDATKQRVLVAAGRRRCSTTERHSTCGLAGILFTVVHLLLELLGLLLVGKRQPRKAVLKLESVEEDTVLVVVPRVVNFLIPDHTAVSGLDGLAREGEKEGEEVNHQVGDQGETTGETY